MNKILDILSKISPKEECVKCIDYKIFKKEIEMCCKMNMIYKKCFKDTFIFEIYIDKQREGYNIGCYNKKQDLFKNIKPFLKTSEELILNNIKVLQKTSNFISDCEIEIYWDYKNKKFQMNKEKRIIKIPKKSSQYDDEFYSASINPHVFYSEMFGKEKIIEKLPDYTKKRDKLPEGENNVYFKDHGGIAFNYNSIIPYFVENLSDKLNEEYCYELDLNIYETTISQDIVCINDETLVAIKKHIGKKCEIEYSYINLNNSNNFKNGENENNRNNSKKFHNFLKLTMPKINDENVKNYPKKRFSIVLSLEINCLIISKDKSKHNEPIEYNI